MVAHALMRGAFTLIVNALPTRSRTQCEPPESVETGVVSSGYFLPVLRFAAQYARILADAAFLAAADIPRL